MENTSKNNTVVYLENLSLFLWGIFFLSFPLFFLTATTDAFILPKQMLMTLVTLVTFVLIGVKAVIQKKVQIRRTPLDIPVIIFTLALLVSALFSADRYNSLATVTPIVISSLGYFVIVNTVKKTQTIFFLLSTLVTGATLAAIISLLASSNIYIFTLPFTRVTTFSPFGSQLDEAMYLGAVLPIAISFALPLIKGRFEAKNIIFGISSLVLAGGLFFSAHQAFVVQKVLILPFTAGFQIAFAAISQDAPRIAQGFFFGSGIGTFFTDFTRFKQASFNSNQTLWYLNFNQSSSFVLEILATTGILGFLSYIFIIIQSSLKAVKNLTNPMFLSLGVIIILSILLPFSITIFVTFLFILALFSSMEGVKHPGKAFDLEVSLVTLRKNFLGSEAQVNRNVSRIMPIVFLIAILMVTGIIGFFASRYVYADMLFNQSSLAANNNNGVLTYQKQVEAINTYPYKDSYYRIFSQTNFAIANSLVALNSGKSSSPSAQTQNTILNLIQQSITTAKEATTLSPLNPVNWQNLGSVYRGLIGFGQNADSFAAQSMQQAINLDPTNPQEYIALGGLYYQLQQYDNAIRIFQTAVNLKPDYANAYYNLGHSYEAKGDFTNALTNYEAVKTLTQSDSTNQQKISLEITAVQKKIGNQAEANQKPSVKQSITTQEPLNINQPTTQLPQQQSQVQLPPPATSSAK